MRGADLADVDAAARVLLARPEPEWAERARDLIRAAHDSDRIRKRLMRAIPGRGSGSLLSEAMTHDRVTASRCDARYFDALAEVLRALRDWRADPDRRSPRC